MNGMHELLIRSVRTHGMYEHSVMTTARKMKFFIMSYLEEGKLRGVLLGLGPGAIVSLECYQSPRKAAWD